MARQQFQHALRHYQRIADIAPEDTHAWSDIGDAHRALGNIEEAETSYKRAIERGPHTPIHYSSLGLLYKEQGQFPKAIAVLEEGLRANPDSLNMHVYLIAAYLSQGEYQQAERFLDQAEQLAPGDEVLEDMRNEVTLRKRFDASKAKRLPIVSRPKRKHKK
jgi:tetratricopeptide (TPR) repeat protein